MKHAFELDRGSYCTLAFQNPLTLKFTNLYISPTTKKRLTERTNVKFVLNNVLAGLLKSFTFASSNERIQLRLQNIRSHLDDCISTLQAMDLQQYFCQYKFSQELISFFAFGRF